METFDKSTTTGDGGRAHARERMRRKWFVCKCADCGKWFLVTESKYKEHYGGRLLCEDDEKK